MNKKSILLFLLLIFKLKVIACSIDKGETYFKEVSPLSIKQQQDTILQNKYLNLKKNIKKNSTSTSLAISLKLLDDSKKANNNDLEYLTTFLIGDLFMELKNHDMALRYLKRSLSLLLSNNKLNFNEKINTYEVGFSKNKALPISTVFMAYISLTVGGHAR